MFVLLQVSHSVETFSDRPKATAFPSREMDDFWSMVNVNLGASVEILELAREHNFLILEGKRLLVSINPTIS